MRWAPMVIVGWLAEQIDDLEKAEVVALACISVACVLRVGEAATAQTSERGDLLFNGEKGWPGIWDVEVGPWTRWGALFLWEIRQLRHGRADLPSRLRMRMAFRSGGNSWLQARTLQATAGTRSADAGQHSCGIGEHEPKPSCWQGASLRQQSLKPTTSPSTNGAVNDAFNSRFMWTRWDAVQQESSITSQRRGLWTVCGRDGSERMCETAKLSDALGWGRVKRRKRTRSAEPTCNRAREYVNKSSSKGEYVFMASEH